MAEGKRRIRSRTLWTNVGVLVAAGVIEAARVATDLDLPAGLGSALLALTGAANIYLRTITRAPLRK